MIFIKHTELLTYVKENVLNGVTENDSNYIDNVEKIALDEIKSYIGTKYDMNFEFSRIDNDRNSYLISIVIDIMLFHLYSRIAPDNIPEIKLQRYGKVIEWLELAAKGKVSPNLKVLDNKYDNNSSQMLWGSYSKTNNTIL